MPTKQETSTTRRAPFALKASGVFFAGLLVAGGVLFAGSLESNDVQFQELTANFAHDIEDPEQSLAWADEVVVLKIDQHVESFEDEFGFPRTTYEATVHKALDSTYSRGDTITVQQEGGFFEDEIFVIEGEELLTPNRAYVLAGKIGEDGTFHVQAGVSTKDVRRIDSPEADTEFDKWGELGKPGRGLGNGQGNGQGNNGNGQGNNGNNGNNGNGQGNNGNR